MKEDITIKPTGLYVGDSLGEDMCALYEIKDGTCPDEGFVDGLYDEVVGTIREYFGLRLYTIDSIGRGRVVVTLLDDDECKYTESFSIIEIMQKVNQECDYNNINNI
ncbi:MAG: hypothetical protein ACRC9P_02895 [Bacteroides sp.]